LLAQGTPLASLPISNLSENPESPPPIHSLQLRVTAENVSNDWSLSVGKISAFRFPTGNGIRVDTHLLSSGPTVIGTDFDSLIAKIIISAPTWEDVVQKAKRALVDTHIEGVKTNLDVLHGIVSSSAFANQNCDTQWLESNLASILESGKEILSRSTRASDFFTPAASENTAVSSTSSVLFRKGDAWSISLTPEASEAAETGKPTPSHLQLIRVLRNDFPASLTAQITYTSPSVPSSSYLMTIASTTASFGSLSSATTHRRGDSGNQNHIIIPIAGKLVEMLVDVDDEIAKGDVVAVVRQMKMELEIRAGKAGRVVWVYEGEEGDDVGEGVLVAELVASGEPKL